MNNLKKGAVIPKADEKKNVIVVTPKNLDKKTPVFGKKLDDVLKENEDLKKQLAKKAQNTPPEKFEDLMKFYQERNKKIKILNSHEIKSKELSDIQRTIDTSIKSGDFDEVPDIFFTISAPGGEYNRVHEVLKVSNYAILTDVVKFINTLMINKIEDLKAEIQA